MQAKTKILLGLSILVISFALISCNAAVAVLPPTPTPTQPPATATLAPTPTPDAITLCNIPQNPQQEFTLIDNDLLTSYLTYLNQGGDWQKLLVFSAHRIIPLDLDNDQNQDFFLENQNDLHLLYCTQDGYRSLELSQELITPNHQTVQKQLLTYGDYNQNQKPEFFLQAPFCDLDFCYTHLEILEWDGKEFANILETPIDNLRYPQADLQKTNGAYQLIVRTNPILTTKSGLVRAEEIRFSPHPSTGHWQQVSQTYDLSLYRLHYLIDGENAYAAGDYELAKAFYLSVVYDQNLLDYRAEEFPQQVENITAVAQMRLVELHFRNGEYAEAYDLYQWMDENYAYGTPAYRIRGLARAWTLEYEENGLEATYQSMKDYISFFYTDFQDLFDENYYGTLNPFPLQTLCNLDD